MKIKNLKTILFGAVCTVVSVIGASVPTFADVGIGLSPMNQKIVLTPGETYRGSFTVQNGASNNEDLTFGIVLKPFRVTEDYSIKFENNGDYNKIINWTTIDVEEGRLSPNEKQEVHFAVNVPKDAPAGGQYMAISVASKNDREALEGGANINVKYAMSHIIYAEIAGTTERKGEVDNLSIPSFMFSGKISGTSSVKNTGNVHSEVINKLQVFPLFSNEEVYTNVEDPDTKIILPGTTRTNVTTWEETPSMGIFNVVYTVEFEGVVKEVKKMVIICPIWLLVIIIALLLLIIFGLVFKSKKSKKNK